MISEAASALCTICARGGSKGVPGKNIRELCGEPLIVHTIRQALETDIFEHVVISTDCEEIAEIAIRAGGEVFFLRAAELSIDQAGKIPAIRDAFRRSELYFGKTFPNQVDLDATSPLRDVSDIQKAYESFISMGYGNLFSVSPSRKNPYFNMVEVDRNGKVQLINANTKMVLSRQAAPKVFDINGSIYCWRRDVILESDTLFLEDTGIYEMPEERSIDIDTELDFDIVSMLMARKSI